MMKTSDSSPRFRRGHIEVILAALLFAGSVPAGKVLLAGLGPLELSGALYLSAGLFSAALIALAHRRRPAAAPRAGVRGREWLWLTGAVLCGGILAPLALLAGLRQVSGHVAGLLLNFEAVFTIALGVVLSGEYLGRRGWAGTAAVIFGAVLLALPAHASGPVAPTRGLGIGLVIAACALWGLDNNLTQRVSQRDARQIVAVKGLVGGGTSLLLAGLGGQLGDWSLGQLVAAAIVGALSFGLSIALFVRGLRQLGVLRTGTLFALAPGFAAILAWVFLREPIGTWGLAALALMSGGALLLASDLHDHLHEHAALEHAHEHEHDAHHQHTHTPAELAEVPHAHWHRHEPLAHRHAHAHDVHHRHRHR